MKFFSVEETGVGGEMVPGPHIARKQMHHEAVVQLLKDMECIGKDSGALPSFRWMTYI